ncbi:MAG: nuclear transport factor 2 family protein [bacterium]
MISNKNKIIALLKNIEIGAAEPVRVINEIKYIQHNPQTHEGSEGLTALFKKLSKTSPRVNIVRAFEDGEYVFAHTEYDFSRRNIGFEVFRFEQGQAVEHWDNIQERKGPNPAGYSMVDGTTHVVDKDKTEQNRQIIREFVDNILIGRNFDVLKSYFDQNSFIDHNPYLEQGLDFLYTALTQHSDGRLSINYQQRHHLLAEGNFVLTACKGTRGGQDTAFYDLFRLNNGVIAEHWDTTEKIVPDGEWKNMNGKF